MPNNRGFVTFFLLKKVTKTYKCNRLLVANIRGLANFRLKNQKIPAALL
jgi:hypothetical protein